MNRCDNKAWVAHKSETNKSVHRECTTTAQPSIYWVLKCARNCKLLPPHLAASLPHMTLATEYEGLCFAPGNI